MTIDFMRALQKPLDGSEVEFRVSRKVRGGSFLLAYKDARVDMRRLDEVFGPFGWQRHHSRDNANCIVSIRDPETGEWIEKEDTGSESNTEAAKGLASDSFKRACFNLGIGRELYDYPDIYVPHEDNEKIYPQSWKAMIQSGEDGRPTFIGLKDNKGNLRFKYGEYRE